MARARSQLVGRRKVLVTGKHVGYVKYVDYVERAAFPFAPFDGA